jgi:hypothetical protein
VDEDTKPGEALMAAAVPTAHPFTDDERRHYEGVNAEFEWDLHPHKLNE